MLFLWTLCFVSYKKLKPNPLRVNQLNFLDFVLVFLCSNLYKHQKLLSIMEARLPIPVIPRFEEQDNPNNIRQPNNWDAQNSGTLVVSDNWSTVGLLAFISGAIVLGVFVHLLYRNRRRRQKLPIRRQRNSRLRQVKQYRVPSV